MSKFKELMEKLNITADKTMAGFNTKLNRYILFGVTVVLYFVLILLLFAEPQTSTGKLPGWIIAIIVGLSAGLLTALNIYEASKYNRWSVTAGLSMILVLQLIMISFSLVDIAGAANHEVSMITFIAFPITALIGNAINIK